MKDINLGSSSSGPSGLTTIGDVLVFAAASAIGGTEPWRSDGTNAGTFQLADVFPGFVGSDPAEFVLSGASIYFAATNSLNGRELWRTNGSAVGTVLAADINAGLNGSSPAALTDVAGTLYFSASNELVGRELFKTVANVTSLVLEINPGINDSNPLSMTPNGTRLYFSFLPSQLPSAANCGLRSVQRPLPCWSAIPFQEPTQECVSIAAIGSVVYFASKSPTFGDEVFQTRGTPATTSIAADINKGATSSFPNDFYGVQ